jgi:hypothetical protein
VEDGAGGWVIWAAGFGAELQATRVTARIRRARETDNFIFIIGLFLSVYRMIIFEALPAKRENRSWIPILV